MANHFIIRVGDGINFKNSRMPFWGINSGSNNCVKTLITKNIKKGDVLWFMTSKNFGGLLIGVAKYVDLFDRRDESLIKINTYSNEDQNWIGTDSWNLQINYTDFYDIEHCDIKLCIQCAASVITYNTVRTRVSNQLIISLEEHYKNIFKYCIKSNKFNQI